MASNTIIVRVLGNTSSLSKSLNKARKEIGGLDQINRSLAGGFRVAAIGAAVFGAAAVGAGAAGAAALAAVPLALAGLGIAFAAQNEKVKKGFLELADHVGRVGMRIAEPLVQPLVRASQRMIGAFDALVPSLRRIFQQTAPLINQFSKGLLPVAKQLGPVLERAFKAGVPVLQAFGAAVKPIIKGLDGFFKELGKGTPQFSEFVKTLGKGLKELLPAIGRLFTALAPIGTAILQTLIPALVQLLDWISAKVGPAFDKLTATIAQHPTLFKNIGIGILAFVAAIKVAQVAMAAFQAVMVAVTVVTKAFQAVALVVRAAIIVWRNAQLALNIAMMLNPIGLVIAAIVALVAIFVIAYKKSETFRNVVNAAWNGIKAATVAVWNFLKAFTMDAWNSLKNMVTAAVNGVKSAVTKSWSAIKSASSATFNAIKSVVTGVWNALKSATTSAWNAIKNAVQNAVNGVKNLVSSIKGHVMSAMAGAAGWLLGAGKAIIQGLLDGIGSMIGSVKSKLGELTNMIPDWKGPRSKDKKLLRPVGRLIMKGLIKGFEDGREGIKNSLGDITDLIEKSFDKRLDKNIAATTKRMKAHKATSEAISKAVANLKKANERQTKSAIKSLGNETKALMRNAKKREVIYKRLENAQKALADVKKARADYATSIKNNILAYGSLGNLNSAFNANAMLAALKAKVEKARTYTKLLMDLIKMGLNKNMIDQLAQAGVEGGLAYATAIATGGPAAITEFNALQKDLDGISTQMGNATASSMYDAGVQAAAGLVKGLESQATKLEKAAKKLALVMVRAIKKALGIHSPSRVFARLGEQTTKGLEIGLKDITGVQKATVNIGDAMVKSFDRPQLTATAMAGPGGTGGNTYQITVTAPATVDKAALGRELVGAIDAYERKGGRKRA